MTSEKTLDGQVWESGGMERASDIGGRTMWKPLTKNSWPC